MQTTKIFPFPIHFANHHINPNSICKLSSWIDDQSDNLQYLYDDMYELLNKSSSKNFLLFTGPKNGIHKRIVETLLHPLHLTPMDLFDDDYDDTYMYWILSKDAVLVYDPVINNHNYSMWLKLLSRSKIAINIYEDNYEWLEEGEYEREGFLVESKPFILFAEEGKLFDPSLPLEKREKIEKFCLQEYKMSNDYHEPILARPIDVFNFFRDLHNWHEGTKPCNYYSPSEWDADHLGCAYDEYKTHDVDANGYCHS